MEEARPIPWNDLIFSSSAVGALCSRRAAAIGQGGDVGPRANLGVAFSLQARQQALTHPSDAIAACFTIAQVEKASPDIFRKSEISGPHWIVLTYEIECRLVDAFSPL